MNGGDRIGEVLARQGVRFLFTLCGGHISPILVGAKARGIRVVDVRDEANAVFAADAVARMSGTVGVAAVTAGPGLSNTITAVKNAQLAQSPVLILGGATATVLRGRGSLQDIDQLALMRPHVKWATSVGMVRDLVPVMEKAIRTAKEGVPGPVFVECPVDLLYPESLVKEFYGTKSASDIKTPVELAIQGYLRLHLKKVFAFSEEPSFSASVRPRAPEPDATAIKEARALLAKAERPVLLVGSQAVVEPDHVELLRGAIDSLQVPTFLSGMARGLLGTDHPLWFRHKRTEALREADLVLLAGVPADFRLNYGRAITGKAKVVALNRSAADANLNRKPTVFLEGDAALGLASLGRGASHPSWVETLRHRERARDEAIASEAKGGDTGGVNPVAVAQAMDRALADDSVLVADGGDFVGTASYVVRPRSPLSWLDPGVFGTLGVGAGFALGAKLQRPASEVWILYGDGSFGYTLNEYDSYVRHGLPVIGVVGNDGSWQQIARDQVPLLGDAVGTELAKSDYHKVVEGFGAKGILVRERSELEGAFAEAKASVAKGVPALVNVHIATSEFRKGSISM
jgi:acetolactate synthase-1/2/3 large subunit